MLNPAVLVKVLSPSTEAYDRGGKFAHYRKIATLREYLLVITLEQPIIERYLRQENVWVLTDAVGLEASVPLESIDCALTACARFTTKSWMLERIIRRQNYFGNCNINAIRSELVKDEFAEPAMIFPSEVFLRSIL